jgi:hypothetical protein
MGCATSAALSGSTLPQAVRPTSSRLGTTIVISFSLFIELGLSVLLTTIVRQRVTLRQRALASFRFANQWVDLDRVSTRGLALV